MDTALPWAMRSSAARKASRQARPDPGRSPSMATAAAPTTTGVGEHMDLRKLKTLIDLVSESNISELEITEADGKVRIVKSDPQAVLAAPMAYQPVAATPAPAVAAAVAPAPAVEAVPAAPAGHVV